MAKNFRGLISLKKTIQKVGIRCWGRVLLIIFYAKRYGMGLGELLWNNSPTTYYLKLVR